MSDPDEKVVAEAVGHGDTAGLATSTRPIASSASPVAICAMQNARRSIPARNRSRARVRSRIVALPHIWIASDDPCATSPTAMRRPHSGGAVNSRTARDCSPDGLRGQAESPWKSGNPKIRPGIRVHDRPPDPPTSSHNNQRMDRGEVDRGPVDSTGERVGTL